MTEEIITFLAWAFWIPVVMVCLARSIVAEYRRQMVDNVHYQRYQQRKREQEAKKRERAEDA